MYTSPSPLISSRGGRGPVCLFRRGRDNTLWNPNVLERHFLELLENFEDQTKCHRDEVLVLRNFSPHMRRILRATDVLRLNLPLLGGDRSCTWWYANLTTGERQTSSSNTCYTKPFVALNTVKRLGRSDCTVHHRRGVLRRLCSHLELPSYYKGMNRVVYAPLFAGNRAE